jgi:hypothetical protein
LSRPSSACRSEVEFFRIHVLFTPEVLYTASQYRVLFSFTSCKESVRVADSFSGTRSCTRNKSKANWGLVELGYPVNSRERKKVRVSKTQCLRLHAILMNINNLIDCEVGPVVYGVTSRRVCYTQLCLDDVVDIKAPTNDNYFVGSLVCRDEHKTSMNIFVRAHVL